MKNGLKVTGKQNFMGIEIPIIEGGFGEYKRIVTAKTVSEIHNVEIKEVTKSINRLLEKKRLKENVDYIDVVSQVNSLPMDLEQVFGIKPAYLSRTNNIYILSERGYTKLIKAMDDDKSWEVMDNFVDSYFELRNVVKEVINAEDLALLRICKSNSPEETALAVKEYRCVITQPLVKALEEQKPLVDFANKVSTANNSIDMGEMAKLLHEKNNIDIGRNRLFEILRNKKILMSNNIPYQTYIERNWFKLIETTKETQYGTKVFTKVLVTGSGQLKIADIIIGEFSKELVTV